MFCRTSKSNIPAASPQTPGESLALSRGGLGSSAAHDMLRTTGIANMKSPLSALAQDLNVNLYLSHEYIQSHARSRTKTPRRCLLNALQTALESPGVDAYFSPENSGVDAEMMAGDSPDKRLIPMAADPHSSSPVTSPMAHSPRRLSPDIFRAAALDFSRAAGIECSDVSLFQDNSLLDDREKSSDKSKKQMFGIPSGSALLRGFASASSLQTTSEKQLFADQNVIPHVQVPTKPQQLNSLQSKPIARQAPTFGARRHWNQTAAKIKPKSAFIRHKTMEICVQRPMISVACTPAPSTMSLFKPGGKRRDMDVDAASPSAVSAGGLSNHSLSALGRICNKEEGVCVRPPVKMRRAATVTGTALLSGLNAHLHTAKSHLTLHRALPYAPCASDDFYEHTPIVRSSTLETNDMIRRITVPTVYLINAACKYHGGPRIRS